LEAPIEIVHGDAVEAEAEAELAGSAVVHKYQYDYSFGEPTMQETMQRLVRSGGGEKIAESGVHSLLSAALNTVGMGACLGYAVALSLLFKRAILRNLCTNTTFAAYADYTLSVSRIVSTEEAAHQLEWFKKVLADPDDCTFSLLPGVPVRNIALLPNVLSGADVICVAVRGGTDEQPYLDLNPRKRSRTTPPPPMEPKPPLVMLHMCCANYDGGATIQKHNNQVAKSGTQLQSVRKCFAAARYKEVAQTFAETFAVIPVLFEMPQRDSELPASEKDYVLVSDRQNWEHVFDSDTMQLLETRGSIDSGGLVVSTFG
jgi:hypothetical protein